MAELEVVLWVAKLEVVSLTLKLWLKSRARDRPEECVGLPVVPEALLLLSAAAEELPGLLALRQLRPPQHAELAQTSVRLCP